jgi:hypothetical protein
MTAARRTPRRPHARTVARAAPLPSRATWLAALAALAAALALALPGRARGADLTIDVWAGFKTFDAVSLESAVGSVDERTTCSTGPSTPSARPRS